MTKLAREQIKNQPGENAVATTPDFGDLSMTFFNRPSPRRPALQQWPQTDDFADFEARVERGEAGNTSQVRYVAQAGVGKAAGAPQPSQKREASAVSVLHEEQLWHQ
jgi:hypothetical protein